MYNKINLNNYIYVDNICINSIFENIHGSNNLFEWLVPSVFGVNSGETRYIKELVNKKINCNFPLLICGDDLDFSCEIVVVKTNWTEKSVIWSKFGTVKKGTNYWENYRNSGIRAVENWTESDWKKYQSIAYDLLTDENFFDEWCSLNWQEEIYRRTWGYWHGYLNNDKNVDWIGQINFSFELNNYLEVFNQNA